MDWITDCAYRIICKQIFEQHGSSDDQLMLWTEFMSADGYTHNPPWVVRHLMRSDYDHETIAQIFWGNPETLIHCASDIEAKYNFAGIELNMGCPSPKIMKCAAGSGMLRDKVKTLEILQEISKNISTPFSLKTRLGLSQDDIQEQFDFLIQASKYVSMIWVHGRTYKQSHAWFVDWDFIYRLKKELPNTLVIGNGGLRSYSDCKEKLHNLDGMMPAQSAIWNPWILTPHIPTPHERYQTIMNHLNLSVACEIYFKETVKKYDHQQWFVQPTLVQLQDIITSFTSDSNFLESKISLLDSSLRSPVEFRKYLFNYITWLPDNKNLKKKIPPARDYLSLVWLLDEYFTQTLDTLD